MKKLLLVLLFASASFAQQDDPYSGQVPLPPDADQAIATTVHFGESITTGVTELVTSADPGISQFAWIELGLFGVFALLESQRVVAMRQMAQHWFNPLASVVAYVAVMFRIVIAVTMLTFYSTNFPHTNSNFHNMFQHLSVGLAGTVTTKLMRDTLTYFNDAVNFLPAVGIFQVMPALLTFALLIVIALAHVAMSITTAGSYAILGAITIAGKIIIPFYVLPGHEKRFWSWFDTLLSVSMYPFVGSAIVFVFCHAYLDFFSGVHANSVGAWLVQLPYMVLITLVFLWAIFKVPDITHMLFGGYSAVAQGFSSAIQGVIVRGVAKALV